MSKPLVFASGSRPQACRDGHSWEHGGYTAGWQPCLCRNAQQIKPFGHHWLRCTHEGCVWTWTDPPHVEG